MRLVSILRALMVVLVLLVLQAVPAGAHARYESSNPADGATVSSPPSQVQADFSEPVTPDSYLRVTDPCGTVVSGASSPVADKVTVSMSSDKAGTYSVYYRVQSEIDSHITDGTFSFTSSGGDPCPGEGTSSGGGGGSGGGSTGSGGGSGDDPGDPGTQSGAAATTGEDSTASAPDGSGGPAQAGGSGGGRGGGRDHSNHEANKANKGKGGRGDGSRSDDASLPIDRAADRQGPAPWEDLPTGGVVAALVISALIGAAGGRIYASMMGPRA